MHSCLLWILPTYDMNSVCGGGKIFERLKGEECEGSGVVLSGVFGN